MDILRQRVLVMREASSYADFFGLAASDKFACLTALKTRPSGIEARWKPRGSI